MTIVLGATSAVGLHRVLDAHRWVVIAQRYSAASWNAPATVIPLLLILIFAWVLAGIRIEPNLRLPLFAGFFGLASVTAAHFAAYLVTPNDLSWHLATSVDRLPLQLLPSFIFLSFGIAGPEFLNPATLENTTIVNAPVPVAKPKAVASPTAKRAARK